MCMGIEKGSAKVGADKEDISVVGTVEGEAIGSGGFAADGVVNIMGMTKEAAG